MKVQAPIKVDRKTKRLAKRLTGGEIAVINHVDIDEVAANSLVEGKIKLVINAAESISGRYPNKGPGILIAVREIGSSGSGASPNRRYSPRPAFVRLNR